MNPLKANELAQRKCRPCEGGIAPLTRTDAESMLTALSGWHLTPNGKAIRREWRVKDFLTAIDFFQHLATLAEEEGHHPDLHLTGYRQVAVELTTHAIGGLSENDLILAAKINQLPVETYTPPRKQG
jgi:4a-hydroxytetrahydrobiopterin dehydratase